MTTRKGRCRLKWVSKLLDINGLDWDYGKLAGIFNLADAEAIAKIKLPERLTEDFLAWPVEKTGIFTVRSAYNLALKLQNLNASTTSSVDPSGEKKLWKHIWSGDVPPKVNVFTWKLCRDALPTKRQKFVKKIEMEGTCCLCGLKAETGFHATIECPQAYNLR